MFSLVINVLSILLCDYYGFATLEPLATASRSRTHLPGNFHLSDFPALIIILAIPNSMFSAMMSHQAELSEARLNAQQPDYRENGR